MERKRKYKKYSKWKSRRWLLTLWACLLISAIVLLGFITGKEFFIGLATALSAIPIGFVSLETLNKKEMYSAENKNGENE